MPQGWLHSVAGEMMNARTWLLPPLVAVALAVPIEVFAQAEIELVAEIAPQCELLSGGGSITKAVDFTTANSSSHSFSLRCNEPLELSVDVLKGEVDNPAASTFTGGTDRFDYDLSLVLLGTPGFAPQGGNSSSFSPNEQDVLVIDTGTVVPFTRSGFVIMEWGSQTNLYAGIYSETVTLNVEVAP